ncbi:RNI-like protein [Gigaspora margarita]|uniref:RNI-like protein n=1 Tax=Gigaspora margarita TaxID=4874 RepID=A0A8H4EKW9_GIGMA|nr:RNI-like protein [Gigaspora margarita]
MAAYLPSDCLSNIFSYFDTDAKSLYSSLLVNRTWCLNVVPILWRRTFYLTSLSNFSSKKRCQLVATYLTCMAVNKIPNPILNGTFPDVTLISSTADEKFSTPTFDYAEFLRGFDYYDVYQAIGCWYAFQTYDKKQLIKFDRFSKNLDDSECCKLILTRELIKYIVCRSPTIDYLALDAERIIPFDFWSFSSFPGAQNCLSYIRTFVCRGSASKLNVYTSLAQWCNNIESITLYEIGDDDPKAEALSNLIRGQRKLCEFILWGGTNNQLSQIINSLALQGFGLKYLEFRFCNFDQCTPLDTLAISCTKLTTLKFIQCGDLQSNITPNLLHPIFPDLEVLDLQGTQIPTEALESIFKCANVDLRNINIEKTESRYSRIIESIANNCKNVTKIKARLTKDKMTQLSKLFQSCNNLESLKLYGPLPDRLYIFTQDASDDILINLRKIVPATLKELALKTDCAFTASAIEIFLKDCHADLNRLEFISYGSVWQHLNVIKKYAKRRGLKIKEQVAGNYNELLMRELGHIIVEFENLDK